MFFHWTGLTENQFSLHSSFSLDIGMKTLPKLQMIYANILDLYQIQHPKFRVAFLPDDSDQEKLAQLYATRLSLKNPFACGKTSLSCINLSLEKIRK